MTNSRGSRPLWTCQECGRTFANRNQSHACGRYSLDDHFEGRDPVVRELFDHFLACVQGIGPVQVLSEKTRIAFHVRMSFAQVTPRRTWLDGHLVLARRVEDPTFRKVETISRRNHVHHFRLKALADVSETLIGFIREAYEVGEQKHLARQLAPEPN